MGRIMVLVRASGLLVAVLLLIWAFGFRASFLPHSNSGDSSDTSQMGHLYSALHPLLMVIGFILLSGEAILAHKWLSAWSRSTRKSVHLCLQGAALGFGLFGIWVKFKGRIGILANFYSLHSWMGLLCLVLFASQWTLGFLRLWHRPENRRTRTTMLPWHAFVGLYTYGLAVITAETGLLEKLTFLQTRRGVHRRSTESTLVNALGLGLAFVSALVVFAAVSHKHHRLPYQSKNVDVNYQSVNKFVQSDGFVINGKDVSS
ncbi:LOW QUALITY PROTEIN: probable transmembrane ascorbate ferrireductase 4 [Asparagus officinalis]|uniref:LOW QUALITY PROTEIN: probable transmembrane ascorbate ferrireductase 4 n=1 Tax=Asparagus officinalis TaxID=4686 RepID=UPI00098E8584|nr:LOW QUALITY PROTEIN: probable transmembrane ascorbate ferrireductase 4 [Asparagus officinalis]